jgi:serine/threonine-protein kinase RsbT
MPSAVRTLDLRNSYDVVQARQCAREMARELGFSLTDQTRFATAVSEVTRRTLERGGEGSVRFAVVSGGLRRGLECVCTGGEQLRALKGPADGGILGGVERLVDEFELDSGDGDEVAVVMRKWLSTTVPSAATQSQNLGTRTQGRNSDLGLALQS